MKILEKTRDIFERLIDLFSFAVFLFIALIGIYAIIDAQKVSASAELDDEIVGISQNLNSDTEHSIAALQKINPEIVGWIRLDDTHIDMPVVWSKDGNMKYLTKNYRGDYATAGAAFVDYRNNGLEDNFSIIYAHRMYGDEMFSDVAKFVNVEGYFDGHKTGVLYTANDVYDIKIISAARPNVSTTQIYNIPHVRGSDFAQIYSILQGDIVKERDVGKDWSSGDKLLLLSTCDKDSNHYRDVILTKLTKRNHDEK